MGTSAQLSSVSQALRLALMLLDKPCRLSDAAEQLGVAPSTAHRLLSTLVEHGFAAQDEPRGVYRAGMVLQSAGRELLSLRLRDAIRPGLADLSIRTEETVHLSVVDGTKSVNIETIADGNKKLPVVGFRTGVFMPAHLTSVGRVLLATVPEDRLRELYGGNSPDDPTFEELQAILAEVRQRGYGINPGNIHRGVYSIAAPVHLNGRPIAAIGISIPTIRLAKSRIPAVAGTVQAAARQIDADLRELEESRPVV